MTDPIEIIAGETTIANVRGYDMCGNAMTVAGSVILALLSQQSLVCAQW